MVFDLILGRSTVGLTVGWGLVLYVFDMAFCELPNVARSVVS